MLLNRLNVLMNRILYKDLSPDMQSNLDRLIKAVNGLLTDLNIDSVSVSSGYRTPAQNSAANGAKKSLHMQCLAVDLLDNKSQDLAKKIAQRPDLLQKHNLWLESPTATVGKNTNWVHLDLGNRANRPSRVFFP